ncbi:phage tail assembly chaperone [Gracilibacillus dipsosauri]|uniref:phage tail assembly chaperone n=1 Tax=Gracilibacillus dipsosauri TaxID=178340 RepID=UPI00240957A9
MSNLQAFFAQNVEKVKIEEHVISDRFKDENGKPIPWKFGAIDGDTDAANRKASTKRMPVPGKKGLVMPETDYELYILKNAVSTIKFPDLNNAELQKSYGVMGAEALLQKMLLPGELTKVKQIAQEVNGFSIETDDLVEQAKN